MSHLHSLPQTRRFVRVDDMVSSGPPSRVIEVGEITAGIAVPERNGVRFFSSDKSYDRLDGTLFRSVEQAARAVRVR